MQNTTQTTDAARHNKTALIIAVSLFILQPMLFILQPVMAQAQDAEERLFWKSVLCEQSEEVALYLEFYPNGAYENKAHDCLRAIAATATKDSAVQKIRQHLLQCAAHFQANRLLTGQGGNALACYKQVLQMAPANAQALAGITAIEDKYIAWARRELQGHDVGRAQTYVQRLKTLNEERAEVAELERRIAQQKREAQVAEAQRKAQVAEAQRKAQAAQKLARQRVKWVGKMVAIPAGRFRMGDLSGAGDEDEKPVHNVRISPFEMGAYEVTVGQFRAFVTDSGYDAGNCQELEDGELKELPGRSWRSPGLAQSDRHPVICVSYGDAQAFIGWLNKKTGGHYRLPTEAEWEYAARAGTTSQFSWGNTASHDRANYGKDECCAGRVQGKDRWQYTAPVGQFAANAWGLHDLHGNVWEWVEDCAHNNYQGAPADGSAWTGSCGKSDQGEVYRVLRGGSWVNVPRLLRSALRFWNAPANRAHLDGFRLVQDLTP